MGLFEIVSKKSGRRLGVVKAKNRTTAVNYLSKHKKLPNRVTVYPVKLKPIKQKINNEFGGLYNVLGKSIQANAALGIYSAFSKSLKK